MTRAFTCRNVRDRVGSRIASSPALREDIQFALVNEIERVEFDDKQAHESDGTVNNEAKRGVARLIDGLAGREDGGSEGQEDNQTAEHAERDETGFVVVLRQLARDESEDAADDDQEDFPRYRPDEFDVAFVAS